MTNVKVVVKDIKIMNNQPNKIYLVIGVDEECQDFEELVGVSWCEDKINDDDLEYISSNFILAEIEKEIKLCRDSRKMAVSSREVFLKQMRTELKKLLNYGIKSL